MSGQSFSTVFASALHGSPTVVVGLDEGRTTEALAQAGFVRSRRHAAVRPHAKE